MWFLDLDAAALLVPVATSTALVIRAWIHHRTTKMRERAKDGRLERLIGDCTPAERVRILRALQQDRRPRS